MYSLWSLLPSFCNYPVDTAESFKGLEKALRSALQEELEVRGIICSSLQILIQQNKKVLEGKGNILDGEVGVAEQRAAALYTEDVSRSNLSVLKSSVRELFSVLALVYPTVSKDTVGILQVNLTFLRNFANLGLKNSKTINKVLKDFSYRLKSQDLKERIVSIRRRKCEFILCLTTCVLFAVYNS